MRYKASTLRIIEKLKELAIFKFFRCFTITNHSYN